MNESELAVRELMASICKRYFPELGAIQFDVVKDAKFEGVVGRAQIGKTMKVTLYYSDDRIIQPEYRIGLVPIIAHELAHFIDPIDPERILEQQLPQEMVKLWKVLLDEGYASCSMGKRKR